MKNKKVIMIILIIITITILLLGIIGFVNRDKSKNGLSYSYSEIGIPKFIEGNFSKEKITNSKEALNSLNELKSKMKFKNVEEELTLLSEVKNDNITYYKFGQMYKNVPVLNHELIISVDKNNEILSLNGYYLPDINIEINPKLSKEQVETKVLNDLEENTKILSSELNIIDLDNENLLVYLIDIYNKNEYKELVVEANTGEILLDTNLLESVSFEYTGDGLNGKETISIEEYQELMPFKTRYRFNDLNRNIEIKDGRTIGIDPIMQLISGVFVPESLTGDIEDGVFKVSVGNNTKEDIVKEAITTMKSYEDIYDYYKKLGRVSYDNKGGKIIVHIGVGTTSKEELNNAFWMPTLNQMFIGRTEDGTPLSVSKDILAHEFTHGVIGSTANFSKVPKNKNEPNETGALNEGISDIMGMLIEDKNWVIGEDSGWNLRNMSNPIETKDPSKKNGEYYYPYGYLNEERTLEDFLNDNNLKNLYSYDNGGIHHNATVVSHSAYLMYENGAVKSKEELARLWYNSLYLMSSYSNFEDCALAVIKTAKNMGMKDSSIEKIKEAFYETNMLEKTKFKLSGNLTSEKKQIPNIEIKLRNEQTGKIYTIRTNNKGEFEFKDLSKGKYSIIIDNEKYKSFKKTLEINNDIEENIDLEKIDSNENVSCDFYMEIDEVTNITLKGPALRGRIKRGRIQIGDEVEIVGKKRGIVKDITLAFENRNYAIEGENVAIFIEDLEENLVDKGDIIKVISCNNDNNYNRTGEEECFRYNVEQGKVNIIKYDDTCSKEVIIPDKIERLPVIKINGSAFSNQKITSVKLPESLEEIDDSAFRDNLLKTITIPDNVRIIGDDAFRNNTLEYVKLGSALEKIGTGAFEGSYYHDTNNIKELIIPNNVKSIGKWAFKNNAITNLKLGNNLEEIGSYAFADNNIEKLIIPNKMNTIEHAAFINNKISSLVISGNLTKIEKSTFGRNKLKEITIPDTVEEIEEGAFDENPLETVVIGKKVNKIGENSFGHFSNKDATLKRIINKSNNEFDWDEILFLMPTALCNGSSPTYCKVATGTIIYEGLKLEITN